jgi:hypothetical protein
MQVDSISDHPAVNLYSSSQTPASRDTGKSEKPPESQSQIEGRTGSLPKEEVESTEALDELPPTETGEQVAKLADLDDSARGPVDKEILGLVPEQFESESRKNGDNQDKSLEENWQAIQQKYPGLPSYAAMMTDRATWRKLLKSDSIVEQRGWSADGPQLDRVRHSAERLADTFRKTIRVELTNEVAAELNRSIPVMSLPSPDAAIEAFGISFNALRSGTVPQSVAGKVITAVSCALGVPPPFAKLIGTLITILLTDHESPDRRRGRHLIDALLFADIAANAMRGNVERSPALIFLARKNEANMIGNRIDECVRSLGRRSSLRPSN